MYTIQYTNIEFSVKNVGLFKMQKFNRPFEGLLHFSHPRYPKVDWAVAMVSQGFNSKYICTA